MEERRAQQQQERQRRDEDGHRPSHDPAREPRPGPLGGGLWPDLADGESVDPMAEEGQQRREEGERRRHREPDDDRPGDAHRPQDHELEEHEPEEAKQDGQTAEEHRSPGGRDRDADRLGDPIRLVGGSLGELLAEATGHEQRVVHPQAQPEQRRQVEHEDAHRRELGDDEDGG